MASVNKNVMNSFYALALARLSLGFIFLWAFLDKLLGLGFSTCREAGSGAIIGGCGDSWIQGGSPTTGFLAHAKGPLASIYHNLAGHAWVDWLFMAGLLFIGVGLLLGVGIRVLSGLGILLLLLMWGAQLWPANNPVLDEHIVYIFVLAAINMSNSQQRLGLKDRWKSTKLVKNFPILE